MGQSLRASCRMQTPPVLLTVKEVFSRDEPLEFSEFWTPAREGVRTVLMTYAENGHGKAFLRTFYSKVTSRA
jgi:hypothetical protein